jgi:predicted glutamine amidotransferase
MLVTRFIASEKGKPHSLYYSRMDDGVVVASERLTDELETWTEVPNNHALQIDQELNISTKLLKPI